MTTGTHPCIGCACHRVPWDQGSDYCDTCYAQERMQCSHRTAVAIRKATKRKVLSHE